MPLPHCHPERSKTTSNANRFAPSRDLAFSVLLGVLFASGSSFAQTKSIQETPPIPKNRRVTIEFESFDKEWGLVKLRLHNFTAWDIRIPVEMNFPGKANGLEIVKSAKTHPDCAEAPVRYYLEGYDPGPWMQTTDTSGHKSPPDEPKHQPVPKFQRFDFMTEWWIPKNQSIVFAVPKEHMARNVELYVYLRYEWESLGTEDLDGPVHLVYFRGIDLPKEIQAQIE
jgi:hypothetical protein